MGKGLLLLSDETLILPETLHGLLTQLVEADLISKDINGDIDRPPKLAPRLVEIEDAIKAGPVAVKEVFIAERVKIPHTLIRISQQCVRKLVEGAQLSLEVQPRDVD